MKIPHSERQKMVELIPYSDTYEEETVKRIADFFGYHSSLLNIEKKEAEESITEARDTLREWQAEAHEFYIIVFQGKRIGFLHLWYKGPQVAWIEDIYVDEEYRSQGIASHAIRKAEEIVKDHPDYTAVCLDVVPRNENALRLYYKLGYDSVNIITLRKELGENKRDRIEKIFGLKFKI
ncbi:MAG TPA: GNAT family N-acetyltransferase [Anaerolineaceae bacterium]|nr:GNAT family N-acetyltransferase [Anaerolineaceae bacterium]